MCLSIKKPLPKKIPKHGWKVFIKENGKLEFPYYNNTGPVKKQLWMTAKPYLVWSFNDGRQYKTGFHCFLRRSDARVYASDNFSDNTVVLKVQLGGKVKAFGLTLRSPTIVVEKIRIME